MLLNQVASVKRSAYGFKCIPPRTRAQRKALCDKVALEKSRLNARTGIAARMVRFCPLHSLIICRLQFTLSAGSVIISSSFLMYFQHKKNAPDTTAGLTSCPADAAGYINNADRFHTDTAGEERDYRAEIREKERAAIAFRRNKVGTTIITTTLNHTKSEHPSGVHYPYQSIVWLYVSNFDRLKYARKLVGRSSKGLDYIRRRRKNDGETMEIKRKRISLASPSTLLPYGIMTQ